VNRRERVASRRVRRRTARLLAVLVVVVLTGVTVLVGTAHGGPTGDTSAMSGMPTEENTGPAKTPTKTMTGKQFLATRRCENARIVTDIHVDDPGPDQSRFMAKTLTMDNCVVEKEFYWSISGNDYPESRYPVFNITNTDIMHTMVVLSPLRMTMERSYVRNGGWWAPCNDCAGPNWDFQRSMPIVVRDSYFRHLVTTDKRSHTEAIMVMGSGIGYRFENVRFTQDGPYNGTQTGAINFSGLKSRFDNVWFDFGGTPKAAYYTVYITGDDNVVNRCSIERGIASYVYPNSEIQAQYDQCTDVHSGTAITVP
jgi:hypothetical protein